MDSLPRTFEEAGIIPIKFKRKLEYKNSHLEQFVSVLKIFKALELFKKLGNKYYQFVPNFDLFKEKCLSTDPENFEFLFPQDEEIGPLRELSESQKIMEVDKSDEENEARKQDIDDQEMDIDGEISKGKTRIDVSEPTEDTDSDEEEKEYITKDPARKWQFDYNASTCFCKDFPELDVIENLPQEDINEKEECVSVAPGEGKIPTNILQEKDWDVKSFPGLHPDAKYGIHEERETRLTDQQYFEQRVMNVDLRFANTPAYVFAAFAFVEKKQLDRNVNISFMRGNPRKGTSGKTLYSLEDPYSVLDNSPGTPRYWQKKKYELIAKLENLGPFHLFFTLSCADKRWNENFTSLLQDHKLKHVVRNGIEYVYIDEMSLEEFLEKHESKHEFIRKNILSATLNFNHRVQEFIKNIIMKKDGYMPVEYYNYRVEFQIRGAGHIHGTLWIDWEKLQEKESTAKADEKIDVVLVQKAFEKIKDEVFGSEKENVIVSEEDNAFEKQQHHLVKFINKCTSCSLKNPSCRHIVKDVNQHAHTRSCKKHVDLVSPAFQVYKH